MKMLIIFSFLQFFVLNPSNAQIPPHTRGTICQTSQLWCWAPTPGPVDSKCGCPTPYGWFMGRIDATAPLTDEGEFIKGNDTRSKISSNKNQMQNLICKFNDAKLAPFVLKQASCGISVFVGSVTCTDENGLAFTSLAACSTKPGEKPDPTKCYNLHEKQSDGIDRQRLPKEQRSNQ